MCDQQALNDAMQDKAEVSYKCNVKESDIVGGWAELGLKAVAKGNDMFEITGDCIREYFTPEGIKNLMRLGGITRVGVSWQ